MYRLQVLLMLLFAACVPATHAAGKVSSVPELEISRYAGHWYEIARLPNAFQSQCVGEVTASYSLREDGLIGVRNTCRNEGGELEWAEGVARPVKDHPGRLKVRFAPDWLSWLPLVWADYWVIDLDPGYTWALVGDPGRKNLWILSRSPSMDRDTFERISESARAMGYDLRTLIVPVPLH